jgi:L-amino acid N-acyltransferase YncA
MNDMLKPLIREMGKSDIDTVTELFAIHWADDRDFQMRLIDRAMGFVNQTNEVMDQKFSYFVADNAGDVVGVAGMRKIPDHMCDVTVTDNPCELYILAVKEKGRGVGKALVSKILHTAEAAGYTEMVLYSGETHQDSWGFYDQIGFDRVGESIAPNGEKGMVWRMFLL